MQGREWGRREPGSTVIVLRSHRAADHWLPSRCCWPTCSGSACSMLATSSLSPDGLLRGRQGRAGEQKPEHAQHAPQAGALCSSRRVGGAAGGRRRALRSCKHHCPIQRLDWGCRADPCSALVSHADGAERHRVVPAPAERQRRAIQVVAQRLPVLVHAAGLLPAAGVAGPRAGGPGGGGVCMPANANGEVAAQLQLGADSHWPQPPCLCPPPNSIPT